MRSESGESEWGEMKGRGHLTGGREVGLEARRVRAIVGKTVTCTNAIVSGREHDAASPGAELGEEIADGPMSSHERVSVSVHFSLSHSRILG